RDCVPSDHPAGAAGLRNPARVDGKTRHPPVWISRCQPSVHLLARAGAGRQGEGPPDHLLPSWRELLDQRDRRRKSRRQQLGQYLVILGGCDVLAFTGGIGENAVELRNAICRNLHWAGIALDEQKNQARGKETKISQNDSRTQIWIVPTNEELVVARQTVDV